MERTSKLIMAFTISLMIITTLTDVVEGGRKLKEEKLKPQNYLGGFGATGGLIPTPFGPTFAFGPSGFCSFPGMGCVRVQPTPPGSSTRSGGIGSPPGSSIGSGGVRSPPGSSIGSGSVGSPP